MLKTSVLFLFSPCNFVFAFLQTSRHCSSLHSVVTDGETPSSILLQILARERVGTVGLKVGKEDDFENSDDDVKSILRACAEKRSVPSARLIPLLRQLDDDGDDGSSEPIRCSREDLVGTFELIFSSGVTGVPVLGTWLDGYMPTRETIEFDFAGDPSTMRLRVETLPFMPSVDIVGENLTWNDDANTLSYNVRGKEEISQWKIIYADDLVVAAKSSVTGLNVIKKVSS